VCVCVWGGGGGSSRARRVTYHGHGHGRWQSCTTWCRGGFIERVSVEHTSNVRDRRCELRRDIAVAHRWQQPVCDERASVAHGRAFGSELPKPDQCASCRHTCVWWWGKAQSQLHAVSAVVGQGTVAAACSECDASFGHPRMTVDEQAARQALATLLHWYH
jgi:hypothetical protein